MFVSISTDQHAKVVFTLTHELKFEGSRLENSVLGVSRLQCEFRKEFIEAAAIWQQQALILQAKRQNP